MDGADLRAQIRADPDNDDLRLVYGDLLQQEGQPQGELIALQALLRGRPADADLLARDLSQRAELTKSLLHRLPEGGVELQWHLGFIASVRIRAKKWGAKPAVTAKRVVGFVERLLAHECTMLRRLEIDADLGFEQKLVVEKLLLAKPPLYALGLGSVGRSLDDLAALSSFALRELRIVGASFDLDELDLPELESLSVSAPWSPSGHAGLLRARVPRLTSLSLEARQFGRDSTSLLDAIAPILAGEAFPKLTKFAFYAGAGAQLVERLVRSSLLARLEELGMDNSHETKAALLRHKAAFAHVRLPPKADWGSTDLHNWGVFLGKMERLLEELVVNEQAIFLNPDPDTYCNQGKVLSRFHRQDEALVLYDRVIREFPKHAEAWYLRGVVFRRRKQWELALGCFQEASRMPGKWGSEEPATWANLAYMERHLGHQEAAREGFEKAAAFYGARIAKDPSDASALFWKASTHALLGDKTSTLAELARAVQLDPTMRAKALNETDFEAFWKDGEFQTLTS